MSRQWRWNTVDAEWSVELDATAGVLHWRGADKPRPGVPGSALSGGEVDQRSWDLLATGRPSYDCPPDILVDVMGAARGALPPDAAATTRVKIPPRADASIDVVLRACQAAVRRLTGATGMLAESRRQLVVEDLPDDRPTQTSATRYVTEVRLGDRALFLCTEDVGGWSQGSSDWFTVDFAGTGRLRMALDHGGVEIEGAPAAVDALANALLINASPDDGDLTLHERADAAVRSRFSDLPGFVWEVTGQHCREGVIVAGRASRAALQFYLALVPPERWFIMHVDEVEPSSLG